jgi:alpha-aminoadipic semialdehyde synthase
VAWARTPEGRLDRVSETGKGIGVTIGIRREDKSEWERRSPLSPADLADLQKRHGLRFLVQPSPIRVFADSEFTDAGVDVDENLEAASLIFAIKEIPLDLIRAGKTYVFFSHVIKGQPHNMPMLSRFLELGCSLVDYERIVDEQNRRLIFFGIQAGHAGMIESLWCLNRWMLARGLDSPFDTVRHAFEYEGLEEAKTHLRQLGRRISDRGLSSGLRPLIFGVAGYGNVSRGCQEILNSLGAARIGVEELPGIAGERAEAPAPLLEVVFEEKDMVEIVEPGARFELQEYYDHPERYRGCFDRHLPHLDLLINATYWDDRYPRLVTREWARESYARGRHPRLKVIGDISCDLEGGVELTLRTTQPDAPCFSYDPATDVVRMGCEGPGPAIMAVDNLPCELPRESSAYFSHVLRDLVPQLAAADWQVEFEELELAPHLKNAIIVHQGKLTPGYRYLEDHLESET